ncbi:translesion error-prone DNA polymerase V autoproteolytic subunit [Flavobacterium agricola]|uniref:Translesion error-prone DNA polymerase V autoproteolytic subunit n=1 Tax=Flavobacterium agricola TaxID=2870839 RepID=A0ABY6M2T3_9FLAO|nr:translesion error-prone DNA polymerase V autoproteolytic subunit [Flavobacterium agricola]UYW01238.1 translesion error-prone DNA polymerase V autoproteolytic subunit [Flavobacterium agricola]
MLKADSKLTFFIPAEATSQSAFFFEGGIKAGFPSPAADFEGTKISLDELVIKNKTTTFYAKASGNSMINAGINDGDILVIDKSLEPRDNKIAVCFIDGEFTVKRIKTGADCLYLVPENPMYKTIKVTPDNEFVIWGLVTHVVKAL